MISKLYLTFVGLGWLSALALAAGPADGPGFWDALGQLPEGERTRVIGELFDSEGKQWAEAQKANLLRNFLRNSDGTFAGAVWASPSSGRPPAGVDPGEPDYQYHWIRDSAIAVESLAYLTLVPQLTEAERANYQQALMAYVDFSRRIQQMPIAHEWMTGVKDGNPQFVAEGTWGAYGVRYGEPKVRVKKVELPDGSFHWEPAPFNEAWGRPQNDGPALRAQAVTTILRVLDVLAKRQQRKGPVDPNLLKARETALTVLRDDLRFIRHRWRDASYDAWEEVLGDHFFNRVVQSQALREGGAYLSRLGEVEGAQFHNEHLEIEKTLDDFFRPDLGYIQATRNIQGGMRKDTDIDMLVLMAALRRRGGPFSISDPRVLATAARLYTSFRDDPAFEMNRKAGLPGIAVGRYPKDPWTGERRLQNDDGSPQSAGHPWIITTLTMGDVFYRAALEFQRDGKLEINRVNLPFFQLVMNGEFPPQWLSHLEQFPESSIHVGAGSDGLFEKVLMKLRGRGNEIGARILASGVEGTSFSSEQFSGDPHAGVIQIGAPGLTWNCASYLRGLAGSYRRLGPLVYPHAAGF